MARAKTFLMRVDEAELAEIDRAAAEVKKSRCAFVREAALNATTQKTIVDHSGEPIRVHETVLHRSTLGAVHETRCADVTEEFPHG